MTFVGADVGGGAVNNDINVETSAIIEAKGKIDAAIAEMADILKEMNTTAGNAITAVGGEGTDVGGALKSAMADVDASEFEKIANSLSAMAGAATKSATTYDDEEAEIMSKIKSRLGQGGGTPNGGGSGLGVNVNLKD